MIEIRDLSYQKGKKQILKNISLSLPQNCIIGILGANGSGKTTLLRHLIRELPSHNKIYLDGLEINHISRKDFAKYLSFVPQNIVYIDEMTIEDVIAMGRYPYKKLFLKYSQEDEKIVNESLQIFDLKELGKRTIGSVSGGEAKRAFIAKAFAQKTKVIVLDEPINHLDIKHQLGLLTLFQNMKEKTILLSIHNIDLALKFCDQIILMKNGEIIDFGKTLEVLSEEKILEAFGVRASIETLEGKKIIVYK